MKLNARGMMIAGTLLMAVGTIVGAFGAHALKTRLTPDRYEVLQTAVHYQFISALGLLLIGVIAERVQTASLRLAGTLLFVGVLFFSGSLYAIIAGAPTLIGVVTPIGGACLIAGWLLAALALYRAPR